MRATLSERTIEAVTEVSEAAGEVEEAPRRRVAGTEADKVRRQQQLRRKTKLARIAMASRCR